MILNDFTLTLIELETIEEALRTYHQSYAYNDYDLAVSLCDQFNKLVKLERERLTSHTNKQECRYDYENVFHL